MYEMFVSGNSLPNAYHEALAKLYVYGETVDCPDYNTTQKESSMTMVVSEPLAEPAISKLFIGGYKELEQYCEEICDGILDFEVERGNWEYTYHSRIAKQLPFIENELKRNPLSRRAVIDIRDWGHDADPENNSPACLQHIQYFVRDNALHCKVLFRSNDAVKATFMNAFALIKLQERLANKLGYAMGSYTHRANSFHCYERDYEMLKGYARRFLEAVAPDDLAYNYKGDWDELMRESKPEIEKMVTELKNR